MAAEQAEREREEDPTKAKGTDELETVPTRDRPLI